MGHLPSFRPRHRRRVAQRPDKGAIVRNHTLRNRFALEPAQILGMSITRRSAGGGEVETMPVLSFGVFGPEAIAGMTAALDAAFEELQDTGEP